jgi:hypothetical protein
VQGCAQPVDRAALGGAAWPALGVEEHDKIIGGGSHPAILPWDRRSCLTGPGFPWEQPGRMLTPAHLQ